MRRDKKLLYPFCYVSPITEDSELFNKISISTNFRVKGPDGKWYIWSFHYGNTFPKAMEVRDVMKEIYFHLMREEHFIRYLGNWPGNLIDPEHGTPIIQLDEEDQRDESERIKQDYFGMDFMRVRKDFPNGPQITGEPSK